MSWALEDHGVLRGEPLRARVVVGLVAVVVLELHPVGRQLHAHGVLRDPQQLLVLHGVDLQLRDRLESGVQKGGRSMRFQC